MNVHTPFEDAASPARPTHDYPMEQAVIGLLLFNNSLVDHVSSQITAADFLHELHRRVFVDVVRVVQSGQVASPKTLEPYYRNVPPYLDVPEFKYLGQLVGRAPTVSNIDACVKTLKTLARFRGLRQTLVESIETVDGRLPEADPAEVISSIEGRLYQLAPKAENEQPATSFAEAADDAIRLMNEAHNRGGGLAGISTGLTALDEKLGGLRPGNVVIIAGRPGMGKTSLAVNIAQHVSGAGTPVAFYSLEMSRSELAARILSSATGISSWEMTTGRVDKSKVARVVKAKQDLQSLPLTIDQSGGLTIPQLHTSARRLRRQGKLDLLVVDYLQLMQGSQNYNGNRVQEITEITNGLKAMAKEFDVPVLALSQLHRGVENRDEKRPQLSDLRDSGTIEQDADAVLMCYREEYYLHQRKPAADDTERQAKWQTQMDAAAGKAEVIVAKNRHGPVGTVELRFDGPRMRFTPAA